MKEMIIEGGKKLSGTINISGAKNSAVALVPASLLSDEEIIIENIPNISDIDSLIEILIYLGSKVEKKENKLIINNQNLTNKKIPYDLAKKLRASYYFMGALLGKYQKVEIYFPGGCSIGKRPINLHLKGFEALGAKVKENDNFYQIEAKKLTGTNIKLDIASVGATVNILLAAVKAEGTTIIENAAKEPEIINIVELLNKMGAKIIGAGTNKIVIEGVSKLHGCSIKVIPDRIEAGTYTILGALIGENLKINNIIPLHISSLIKKLQEMNIPIKINENNLIISKNKNAKNINIETGGYPLFPTDLQQPFTTLLTQVNGTSIVHETIYENRFQNVEYLNKMGANIEIKNDKIKIKGITQLTGNIVKATDLRAGACLVLAGLIAKGTTIITEADHILRGYENIINKLQKIGAKINIKEV